MATFQNALICFALGLGIWGLIGFAIGSRFLPQSLALPFSPLLGWAAHSVIALPLFSCIGMTRPAVVASTVLSIAAALFVLLRKRARTDEADEKSVVVPLLAAIGAILLACAIMSAIIPAVTSDGAALAGAIFDHSKIAMIDDIARLGVPAGNPFFEETGGISRLSYYYLWHFSAAELAVVTGLSGWEADAGITGFTAFSSLTLMMGLAVWLSSRASSAFWVLAVASTSSIRWMLVWIFGWQIVSDVTGWPTGFGGWLFQMAWAPQHVASAGCVVIGVFILVQMAPKPGWLPALALSLVSCAAFESSTWVGGITYPLAAALIGAIILMRIESSLRWRYLLLATAAAALAIALASPFISDQFRASMARADGVPISFLPYEVVDDKLPELAQVLLDVPAYWIIFLFVEFAAFYPIGFLFAAKFAREKLTPKTKASAVVPLAALALVSLGVGSILISTVGTNNDLAWRGVLPGIIVLITFTAAGFGRYLSAMRPIYAFVSVAFVALALVSGFRDLYGYFHVRPQASAKRFLDSQQMWSAVRNHSAPGDRIANNPQFLSDITPWPINISWALLADRRSCYAGSDFALPFAPLTRQRRIEVDNKFTELFAGKLSRDDVDQIATRFNCTLVVMTPEDGAWTTGVFASNPSYQLVDSRPGAWRIYRIKN